MGRALLGLDTGSVEKQKKLPGALKLSVVTIDIRL